MSLGLTGAAPQDRAYTEGQVWEYRTRPQDAGSLLKIQKIEREPESAGLPIVYHVSIIGLHFEGLPVGGELQHAPFSKSALDMSVTKLASANPAFPDAGPGMAQWKEARGGVFTISVADAVSFVEQAMRSQSAND
ncbi:hypothetical protein [Novosphingobium sp. ST904]|uniref:hypothetical protein n=1 Tax=Novosphingobium sp. ST904 TaxID=1684385 RepID=UPI0006C8792F|nr:hypothetical protein [Novosphingobium sp. ST904]